MKKIFKSITVMLIISLTFISPAKAIVPTTDWQVIKSTVQKTAADVSEIASLATAIMGIYSTITSLGQSFSSVSFDSGVADAANQAAKLASSTERAIEKVDNYSEDVGETLTKYNLQITEGKPEDAGETIKKATTTPSGVSLAEQNKHNRAMTELQLTATVDALAYADTCRSLVNPADTLKEANKALGKAVDISQRQGVANDIRAHRMVESQACLVLMNAATMKANLLKDLIGTNKTISGMAQGSNTKL